MISLPEPTKEKARYAEELRRRSTRGERVLLAELTLRRFGVRFEFQVVMYGWIVDFYCPELRLVIEVDGSVHAGREKADSYREEALVARGFYVLRFTNEEVLNHLPLTLATIKRKLKRLRRNRWRSAASGQIQPDFVNSAQSTSPKVQWKTYDHPYYRIGK